jgi:large subunit ribosomal protein L10
MATQAKRKKVSDLVDRLEKSKAVYLTDYQGLTHQELEDLRGKIKETNANYSIVKNTLFKIAVKNSKLPITNIAGPTAVLFANDDPIKPLQVFASFDKNRLKSAFAFGKYLTGDSLQSFVNLEPEKQLQAKLVFRLSSPLYGLANALNWNLQRLTIVLNNIKDKKDRG